MILSHTEMKFVVLTDAQSEILRTLPCRHGTEEIRHSDIRDTAMQECNRRLSCLGGGRIRIDHQEKTITAYGQSLAYGPAKPDTVRMLLMKIMEEEGMMNYTLIVGMDATS